MSKHLFSNIRVPIEKDNPSICRDESKCISCGACKSVCKFNVGLTQAYLKVFGRKAECEVLFSRQHSVHSIPFPTCQFLSN